MIKKTNADRRYERDLEQVIENYIVCICYFYRGDQPPFVKNFNDDHYYWLNTDIGLIELNKIPHDNEELTERLYEIESLIADYGYSNEEIIAKLNKEIKNQW